MNNLKKEHFLNYSLLSLIMYPLLSMYMTNPLLNLPRAGLIAQVLFLGVPTLLVLILFLFDNDQLFYSWKNLKGRYIVVFVLLTLILHLFFYDSRSISLKVLFDFILSSVSISLIMANIKYPKAFFDWFYSKRWIFLVAILAYVLMGFKFFQKHYSYQAQTISFVTSFLFLFIISYNVSFKNKKTFLNFFEPLLMILLLVVMASRISLFMAGFLYLIYLMFLLKEDLKRISQTYRKASIFVLTLISGLVISFGLFFREIFTFLNTELNKRGIYIRIFRLAATGEIFNTSGRNSIIYPVAVDLIEQKPFVGHGIGRVRFETKQKYVELLHVTEENAAKISDGSLYPHNFLLELGAVFGIVLSAVILFYYIKLFYKSYKTVITYFVLFFTLGYIILLLFVSSIFDFKYLWIFIGLMCNYSDNYLFKN